MKGENTWWHNMDKKWHNGWKVENKVASAPPSQGNFCTLSLGKLVGASKFLLPGEVATLHLL
jgi:hypothetical protein